MILRVVGLCVVGLIVAACVVAARGDRGRSAPDTQTLGGATLDQHLVVGGDGARSVVAIDRAAEPGKRQIVLWRGRPGRPLGARMVLVGETATRTVAAVDLAGDRGGVVALGPGPRGGAVRTVAFDASGRLAASQTLSAGGGDASVSALRVAASGAAVVIWQRNGTYRAAVREPGSGRFGTPMAIGPAGDGSGMTVDIAADATVLAAWTNGDGGDVSAALRSPGAARFGTPARLGPGGDTRALAAPGGRGTVIVTTLQYDRAGRTEWKAFPAAGGRVGTTGRLLVRAAPPPTVSSEPSGESTTAAALRPDGSALVGIAYATEPHGRGHGPGAIAMVGGPLDRLRRIATVARATPGPSLPRVEVGADGSSTVIWTSGDDPPQLLGAHAASGSARYSDARVEAPRGGAGKIALAIDGQWALAGGGEHCAHQQPCALIVRRLRR